MTETIRIELSARYSQHGARQDCAACEWSGRRFEAVSRHGATMELAGLLVKAGCPDLAWEAGRPGKRDLFGPSLHRLAALAVHESDDDGPVLIELGEAPLGRGRLEPDTDSESAAADTRIGGSFAPMPQPQVNAIIAAIEAARAYPVPVFQQGRVTEVAIYRNGQWFGSLVRDVGGGLLALDQTSRPLRRGSLAPEPAVAAILRGATKAPRKATFFGKTASQDGADAPAGSQVAPPAVEPLAVAPAAARQGRAR